jgi:hypothetical protein
MTVADVIRNAVEELGHQRQRTIMDDGAEILLAAFKSCEREDRPFDEAQVYAVAHRIRAMGAMAVLLSLTSGVG